MPVRPFGSTTASRFAPVAAVSLPVTRCTSTTRFGLPRLPSPLPSGSFSSLGIKAFNRVCCLPVHLANPPDFHSLLAARPNKSLGCGSSFQVRYVSAGFLFLKPLGTFFTMLPIGFSVKLLLGRAAGSERKSGGFARWTGRQQTRLNALILRELNLPEGSGDRRRGRPNRVVEVQRVTGSETAATGANRDAVVEPKGRTGMDAYLEGSEVAGWEL